MGSGYSLCPLPKSTVHLGGLALPVFREWQTILEPPRVQP